MVERLIETYEMVKSLYEKDKELNIERSMLYDKGYMEGLGFALMMLGVTFTDGKEEIAK